MPLFNLPSSTTIELDTDELVVVDEKQIPAIFF
jgi:hypothetical protein